MKQTIFFDLDDTLVYCNKYFYASIRQFAAALAAELGEWRVTVAEIEEKQTEIDVAGIQQLGFASDHFPQSFVETYRYFADRYGIARSASMENLWWEIGQRVYEHEVEPYPFMQETLDKLASAGHELHLYTGGEQPIQQRKIDAMKLNLYFEDRIYVRKHKNNEALEAILAAGGFEREQTWMIGNSIRTDVIPALTAGIHAIHMKVDAEWAYNVAEIAVQPRGAFLTLDNLPAVPPAIDGYLLNKLIV